MGESQCWRALESNVEQCRAMRELMWESIGVHWRAMENQECAKREPMLEKSGEQWGARGTNESQ
eukprot:11197660-Lingulodinium_polyedra.AAC.1